MTGENAPACAWFYPFRVRLKHPIESSRSMIPQNDSSSGGENLCADISMHLDFHPGALNLPNDPGAHGISISLPDTAIGI
jgi:hypothetical protein